MQTFLFKQALNLVLLHMDVETSHVNKISFACRIRVILLLKPMHKTFKSFVAAHDLFVVDDTSKIEIGSLERDSRKTIII